ncbi:phosphoribosyltransferase [Polaribacter sp. SA4-10]|uniref:phosphoribosyltransferase n=1 Tax=Polaribacter sp. SA4-10 TaxID=754397 RepID=UPI000B3C7D66|nr:phosphoribosyltransferase family protein [Polaribacter sp. SA4-10]ARV07268.1 phosphoribosyltransferase [Polaribacter sp. SA4-10]
MFRDRIEAAELLVKKLIHLKDKNVVVLAIPRGGLPLGYVISKELNVPLDIVLTKKIGHPTNKEYAIGAVSLKNSVLGYGSESVSEEYLISEIDSVRETLKKRLQKFYTNVSPQNLKGKTVIIVDDGIATGNTILVTIELVQNENPAKIIVAVPVAPPSAIQKLKRSPYLDEVICLEQPYDFNAVGNYYDDFNEVSDNEAIYLLEEANSTLKKMLQ